MFSFSSASETSTPPRRMGRYALYLGAALIVLWVGVKATSLVPSAPAEDAESASGEVAVASSESSSGSGVEVFTWGNLAAVLLLVGGGGYAFYLQRNESTASPNAMLRPVGRLAVGQSQQLRLVACADEVLLLGVTDEEVTLLKTYSPEAFDDPSALAEAGPEGAGGDGAPPAPRGIPEDFSDVLDHFVRRDAST